MMNIFGKAIPLDRRVLVGFARNISLVSEAEYQNLVPPQNLSHFPADLDNDDLEYSGIYEDGWVAEKSYFYFTQPTEKVSFSLKGMVPWLPQKSLEPVVTIMLDGKTIVQQKLNLGVFNVEVPVRTPAGKHKIEVNFSDAARLPDPDTRFAAAKLTFIGFESNAKSMQKD